MAYTAASTSSLWYFYLVLGLLSVYFAVVLGTVITQNAMFWKVYARRHRLAGLCLLLWLCVGFHYFFLLVLYGEDFAQPKSGGSPSLSLWSWSIYGWSSWDLCYNVVLGLLGTLTAYTAAKDFEIGHGKSIKNVASGVLDENATVTHSEMVEHIFYQVLNLLQILYFHALKYPVNKIVRYVLLAIVTLPWAFRQKFPVNKFQENYTQGQNPLSFISLMYRTKKYQYIFYKHFLLHGLNISLVLINQDVDQSDNSNSDGINMVTSLIFRAYWLCLNVSYVMEVSLSLRFKGIFLYTVVVLFDLEWFNGSSHVLLPCPITSLA